MGKMIEFGSISVYQATPNEESKGAILLIHEVWGLVDHIKDVADRFANEGYTVFAPDLLSEFDIEKLATPELQHDLFNPEKRNTAQPVLRQIMAPIQSPEFGRITIDKIKVCFDEIYQKPVSKKNIAVIGYCFGGSYSFHLAANEPRLKAAVAYYGHADLTEEQMAGIRCPILAFYGENDERLVKSLPEFEQHMKDAGVQFKAKVYDGTGHAFFNDTNPYSYNAVAAKDSWNETLSFLKQNISYRE